MTLICDRMLKSQFCSTLVILTFFLTGLLCTPIFEHSARAATRIDNRPLAIDFPIYPSIRPNVEFWIDIFTHYSAHQGVVHDSNHVNIIYDVLQLDPSQTVRAKRKNKRIKKATAKKYKGILLKLSSGSPPVSKEEKRVAELFGKNVKLSDFKRAAFNIRCQTGLKEEFKAGLSRSGAVIDSFKKTFQAHGLPVELVYLPCVESSYNFKAYSKFGAAGIWQFTRSTGRQYMKINYVIDERRDPYISTIAAARLLKKNYRELKNWPMAITAYNHGLAGMKRARKSKGTYENIFRFYRSRTFKFASRNFYSEFLAAKEVAANPDKYFGHIAYRRPKSFTTIRTRGYLSLKSLTDALNISAKDIKELNPSLRPPVFNGQKYIPPKFKLRFPAEFSPTETGKSLAGIYLKKQKPSRFHRVQKGDTAGSIARIHSVKLSDLILANQLNRRATIYIGQNLRIPVKDEVILASKTKEKKNNSKKPKAVLPPPKTTTATIIHTPKAPAPAIPISAPKAEPMEKEHFINPNIVIGNLKFLKTWEENGRVIGTIRVEAEETLGHYADWLQIPTQQIRVLNGIRYGRSISIDQKIKLPIKKTSIQEFEVKRYEYHKEIEEDFFESFSIQAMEIYKVKNGDNIWTLCMNELEIPLWLVKKYNPKINFNTLYPKQKIHYPVLSTQTEN